MNGGITTDAGIEELRCGISIVRLGNNNSLSVDLTQCIDGMRARGIPCDHSTIHSTVLWRKRPFRDADIKLLLRFRKKWLGEKGRPVRFVDGGYCTFDASQRWGPGSNYIHGELEDFILEARRWLAPQLGCDPTCSGRPPHVSLRNRHESGAAS